jgi:biopolymer transport protein ExbD
MQRIVFSVTMFLFAGILVLHAQQPLKLFLPKDAEVPAKETPLNPVNAFTLVLAGNDVIYYYSGNFKKDKPEKTSYKEVRKIIEKKKKALGDSLFVLIKPSGSATYKNTVDILDEMFINDIKRYALIDIAKEEEKVLGLKPFITEPENYVVETPKTVTTRQISYDDKYILLVSLDSLGKIGYGFGKGMDQQLTHLPDSDSARLGGIFKELIAGKPKFEVFVKGNQDAKYNSFKWVIDALKENNLFKFQMITEKD